jgi:SAM-dependent methyltransferase
MQLTPALTKLCGYESVTGAYFGPPGQTARKQATIKGVEVLTCDVDLFDAERDSFPYPDGRFELVLACEIIEHLKRDPMHLLLEAHRVLEAEGLLLLTTPNCSSATAVARALRGDRNPYTFSSYPRPDGSDEDQVALHIREYTVAEIGELLDAAGFAVEALFTERIAGFPETGWVEEIIEAHGLPTDLRGEQIYCLARKRRSGKITRYPEFLYTR